MSLRRALALFPAAVLLGHLVGGQEWLGEWCGTWGLFFSALALLIAWHWPGQSRWDLRCGAIGLGTHVTVMVGFMILLGLALDGMFDGMFDAEEQVYESTLRIGAAGLCLCVDAFTSSALAQVVPTILDVPAR